MNIVFLDFDGVLNEFHEDCNNACYDEYFDKRQNPMTFVRENIKDEKARFLIKSALELDVEKVLLLNELVEQTGCYFALSTSWRGDPDCILYLTMRGFNYPELIVGTTPRGENRGDEILSYLSSYNFSKYVILDDEVESMVGLHDEKCIVKTKGLNRDNVDYIINYFND